MKKGVMAARGSSDFTACYITQEEEDVLVPGERRRKTSSRASLLPHYAALVVQSSSVRNKKTHSRAGSGTLSGLIPNPKPNVNTYHTNPQQLT